MLALRALTLLLPALSAAYSLKACTDTGCKEGCVDFSADDVSSDSDCMDFGFVAKSVYWARTLNTLDGWYSPGCKGGTGKEDAWINSGNPANNACMSLADTDFAKRGIRYYIVNNSAE